MEQAVHDRGAARIGEQFAEIADQAARRRVEHEAQAIAARGAHFDHLALALGHFLHDDARMLLVDVDHHFLDRLEQVARFVARIEHFGTRDAEFEAFAAHRLDQDRELQFAAAGDDIGVGIGRRLDMQRDIALGLLEQAVADDAARHLVALGAGERADH